VADDFGKYGLELVDFLIGAITPPEEVQKMIDERAGMGAIGDMQRTWPFKAARGIEAAANNPARRARPPVWPRRRDRHDDAADDRRRDGGRRQRGWRRPAAADAAVSEVQNAVPVGSKFCNNCGASMAAAACPKCNTPVPPGAKFCGNCGNALG
jgi:membrane protease subunit (stomatin/prohibitin family)